MGQNSSCLRRSRPTPVRGGEFVETLRDLPEGAELSGLVFDYPVATASIESNGNALRFLDREDGARDADAFEGEGCKAITLLNYECGDILHAQIHPNGPVLSGFFTGCPFIRYRLGSDEYVTHIGTSDRETEASAGVDFSTNAKRSWNEFVDTNASRIRDIRFFNPVEGYPGRRERLPAAGSPAVLAVAEAGKDSISRLVVSLNFSGEHVEGFFSLTDLDPIEPPDFIRGKFVLPP